MPNSFNLGEKLYMFEWVAADMNYIQNANANELKSFTEFTELSHPT